MEGKPAIGAGIPMPLRGLRVGGAPRTRIGNHPFFRLAAAASAHHENMAESHPLVPCRKRSDRRNRWGGDAKKDTPYSVLHVPAMRKRQSSPAGQICITSDGACPAVRNTEDGAAKVIIFVGLNDVGGSCGLLLPMEAWD